MQAAEEACCDIQEGDIVAGSGEKWISDDVGENDC
jgi:hypothetical protein